MTDGAFDRSSLLVRIASHRVHRIRIIIVVVLAPNRHARPYQKLRDNP